MHRGRFQPGHDPRRHQFTREECQRGFQAAEKKLADLYGWDQAHWMIRQRIGCKTFREVLRDMAGLSEAEFLARCIQE